LELGIGTGDQITRMMWLPGRQKIDDIFSHLDRMHERDRQTDGQTGGHQATAKTVFTHSVAQ